MESSSHPSGPGQAGLLVLVGAQVPACWLPAPQLLPLPQQGRQHQGLASPGREKTTVRVARFKLQIIKITIQNKKTPVSNTPTKSLPGRRARRPGCQGRSRPRGRGERGTSVRPPRGVSSSLRGQKAGAAQGAGWGAGLQVVSVRGSRAAGSSRSLCCHVLATWTGLALEIYCTVLEEAGAEAGPGRGRGEGGRAAAVTAWSWRLLGSSR